MTAQTAPCLRCGVIRVLGGNSSTICADCRSVLSSAELALWKGAA